MKQLTTLFLLVVAFCPAFAQITILTTDMPAVPSTYYNGVDTLPTGTSLGLNGANRTWDFTMITRDLTDTVRHKLPSSTAYSGTFNTATDAVTANNVNYAFFKNSTTNFVCQGLAGDLLNNGSSNLDVTFSPVLIVYNTYPVTYSNKFTSTYGFVKVVNGSDVGQPLVDKVRLTFTATFYDTIDAWGTLTTPIGAYSTIREKRKEYNRTKVETKPFFVNTYSTVSDTYDTTFIYNWLAKETKGAVLTANVSKAGVITKVTYSLTPPATPPVANFTWVNTYGGFVQFTNTSTGSPTSYAWTFGDGGNSTAASPSHTYAANATYNVCLTATNASGSQQYCTNVVVTGKYTTTITGPLQRCSNQRTGVAYTATSRAGNVYTWTATGGSVASGAGTPAITVNWNATGPYSLKLKECNSTGQYCDSSTVTITILNSPATTVNQTICYGTTYQGYTTSGTYTNTYVAANGCDSVRTLNLTVRPANTTTVNMSICAGASFQGHTTSGSYTNTYTAANGCDSTRTLNLTVRPANVTSINKSICPGSSYAGHTTAGTYVDHYTDVNGCDSTRTVNLTIQANVVNNLSLSICSGASYYGYTANGIYRDTFSSGQCDSIRILNLTVLSEIFDTVRASICPGGSYLGYTSADTYTDVFTASNGCDSTRTLNLTVRPHNSTSLSLSICQGDSHGGHSTTGVFTDVLSDVNGCDSTRTLNLTVLPALTFTTNAAICAGQSLFVGGANQTVAGTYLDTLSTSTGCDSIVTTILTLNPVPTAPTVQQSGNELSIDSIGITGVQWFSGANNVQDATNANYTVTANGTYYVVVYNDFNCASTSDTITITSFVGIGNVDASWAIKYYPNPTNDLLNIEVSGIADAGYTLFNSLGQAMYSGKVGVSHPVTIALGTFAEGVYYLKVQAGNEVVTKKVLLVR